MTERFQHARADGSPDWTNGAQTFERMWERVRDLLRFHRGDGFDVTVRGYSGPSTHTLREVDNVIAWPLQHRPLDTVIQVKARSDGYAVVLRRHAVEDPGGQRVLDHARALIGTPYVLGGTDCSWLTMHCYGLEDIDLPHNAHLQHLDVQVKAITRAQIKPGDLLFHHGDEHVSLYLDDEFGGRVIDTEPHDTTGPSGWPSSHLGTGVRIRPMTPGWYCDWAHVNGIGRIVAINGAP